MAAKRDPNILKIAQNYIQVLKENGIIPESAWLFGSFTQQQSDPDNDIDIALVLNDVKEKFFKEVELMKYRRSVDLRIEPHILNAADLDLPFSQNIILNGIKIA